MIFPLEIWEHIFTYVHPVTLINLKSVCKCWNEIIDKVLKNNELWYELCTDEIPKRLWSTLSETLRPDVYYINFHKKDDAKFWMAMYKLWFKCENIVKCKTETMSIEPLLTNNTSEYITCTHTSGNLLAVGTSEGFIYFYNLSNLSRRTKYVVDHKEYVRSVQLLRDGESIVCISCSVNNHVCFWDVNTLQLVDKNYGQLICASYSYCYYAMNNMINIEGAVPRTVFEFGNDSIVAIGADNSKVFFYTNGGDWVRLKLSTQQKNYSSVHVPPLNIAVRHYYAFKPNILMCTTENGFLGSLMPRVLNWKLYNIFPLLHGTPTAILVYCNVVVLGLDSGNVHIYYMNNFAEFDFNINNSKKLTLDSTAVISLNIMVCIGVHLVVSYRNKIHIVKLI